MSAVILVLYKIEKNDSRFSLYQPIDLPALFMVILMIFGR